MRRLLALGIIALLALSALAAPDWTKEKKAGDEALKRKDYETAIRIFELLTRAYPEKIDGFNALGFAYFMNKDNERAVYTFKQALALNPNNPSAQHNLILAVTEQANQDCRDLQYTEAVSLLRGILSSYPNHPETANVYFLLGKVEFYRGGEDQGIADWREVARRVPTSGTARFVTGWDLAAKGDWAGAAKSYQEALKKLPKEAVFRNYYALALARTGKIDQSLAQLNTALKDAGDIPYVDLRMNLARLLLETGQTDAAVQQLREALVQRPDYGILSLWLGAVRTQAGESGVEKDVALAVSRDDRPGLWIFSDPPGARAYLDGRYLGPTPTAAFASAGKHKLTLKGSAKNEQTLPLDLEPGTLTQVKGAIGSLAPSAQPFSAMTSGLTAAPDFILKDRSNHRYRIIQHLHKNPIVLLFWKAGTGNEKLLDDLAGLCDRYEIEGAAIHGDPARAKQAHSALLSRPNNFGQLFDDGRVTASYGVSGDEPIVVLINVDGFIAQQTHGADAIWELEPTIRRMLGLPGDRP